MLIYPNSQMNILVKEETQKLKQNTSVPFIINESLNQTKQNKQNRKQNGTS